MILCRRCRKDPATVWHHVVYQQAIRRAGGDTADRDLQLPLCDPCHSLHHGRKPLALTSLRAVNFTAAAALLGADAAYEYLRRRYHGADPRLEALLCTTKPSCPSTTPAPSPPTGF